MNILITGADGFIGNNLTQYLRKNTRHNIYKFLKNDNLSKFENLIDIIDIVFHFAGINKSDNKKDFEKVNVNLTKNICDIISRNQNTSLFFASTIHAMQNNDYGKSKYKAEKICLNLNKKFNNKVHILRLPGIFGIGCKPNYNSVVATFCFNTANNIKLKIIESEKKIELLFVEDLCFQLNDLINRNSYCNYIEIENIYKISVGKLASTISSFHNDQYHLKLRNLKDPLQKNLLKTYISFISEN